MKSHARGGFSLAIEGVNFSDKSPSSPNTPLYKHIRSKTNIMLSLKCKDIVGASNVEVCQEYSTNYSPLTRPLLPSISSSEGYT